MWKPIAVAAVLAAPCVVLTTLSTGAEKGADIAHEDNETEWAPAVNPKPLSENVTRGLQWLVEHQLSNGAWGQGEESSQMGGGDKMKDTASVADTSAATLALIRSGSTPSKGPYAQTILEAVDFVLGNEEPSDCQLARGDVPVGTPPFCIEPDKQVDIFDLLVMIDMATGKPNCCD